MRTPTFIKKYRARAATEGANERGDTLIELLIALVVLGLASVALITALGTTVSAESDHRDLATFNTILTSSSQQALSEMEQSPNLFTTCPANLLSYYQAQVPITVASPYASDYTASITSVQYWEGTNFGSACTTNNDVPQEVQVTVTNTTNGEQHTNLFIASYSTNPSEAASGTAAKLVFTTQPGSGSGGTMLTTQPVIRIEDDNNATVLTDLSPVTLSLTPGTGPSGATLSGCAGDEVLGTITFSGCVISEPGTYTITATDGSLPSAVSDSFSVSATPPSLVFTTQPVAAGSGNTLATQPVLNVDNADGTIDTSFSASISLSSSNGALSGCSSLNAVQGVVTVSRCSFAGLVGTYYTITATANGVLGASSNSITPSGPGSATQLVFSTQTTGTASSNPGDNFDVQPVVSAEDAAGNIITGYSSNISLSISNGETLTCTGGNTQSPQSGKASWSGCGGSSYANNVTLSATSGALSATSAPFNITGNFTKLVFSTEPVSEVSGAPLFTQPVIEEQDASGSVVTDTTTPVSLSSSGGTLSLCSGLTPSGGIINVESCAFGGAIGTSYTMTATATGVSAKSTSFSPTTVGSAYKLVFTTQPVAGASGSVLTTEPVIKIEDQGGNVVTSSQRTISLSSTGTISGCANLTAVSGVVNVTGCTFTGNSGTQYTITASSGGLVAATSSNFETN
jgi:prepilin-type N-terminal cleavage/methylation domain-containing protein